MLFWNCLKEHLILIQKRLFIIELSDSDEIFIYWRRWNQEQFKCSYLTDRDETTAEDETGSKSNVPM